MFLTVFLVLSVVLSAFLLLRKDKSKLPGPPGLPVIGFYPFLSRALYVDFWKLSKKYGDIFYVRYGIADLVVISSSDILDEMFRKRNEFNDRAFGFPQHLDLPIGFAEMDIDDKWQEIRNTSVSILNNRNLGARSFEKIFVDEVDILTTFLLEKFHENSLEPCNYIFQSMAKIFLSIMFSEQYSYDDEELVKFLAEVEKTITDMEQLTTPIMDQVKYYFKLKKNLYEGQAMNTAIQQKCHEALAKSKSNSNQSNPHNFLDEYKFIKDKKKNDGKKTFLSENNLSGTIYDLFLGGMLTTGAYLNWITILLVKYPEVQESLREEIDSVVQKDQRPSLKDKERLPFVNAFLQEVHRFSSMAPLGVYHRLTKSTEFRGYTLPSGYIILPNFWAIHHDERHFKDPFTFNPRRFINKRGGFIRSPHVVAFSSGIRSCPGEVLVQRESFLFLTQLVYLFEMLPEKGVKPKDINIECVFKWGGLLPPAYKIRLVKRERK